MKTNIQMQQILRAHININYNGNITAFAKKYDIWPQVVTRALNKDMLVPGYIAELVGYEPVRDVRYRKIKNDKS